MFVSSHFRNGVTDLYETWIYLVRNLIQATFIREGTSEWSSGQILVYNKI